MSIAKDLVATLRELSALQARTEDVAPHQDRVEKKLDDLIDRLARIEANFEGLRDGVKNQILGELGAQISKINLLVELEEEGRLNWPGEKEKAATKKTSPPGKRASRPANKGSKARSTAQKKRARRGS